MPNIGLSLMTIATLMYGVIPAIADLNRSHATNPRWTSHARFHVVTQVLTTSVVAVISLWLMWSPNIEHRIGVCVATVLSLGVLGAFFIAALMRKRYGGTLSDRDGGIAQVKKFDLNALNFGAAALLLIVGRVIQA